MVGVKETEQAIDRIREVLYAIISDKENLLDKEVIIACENLNSVINKYQRLLEEK